MIPQITGALPTEQIKYVSFPTFTYRLDETAIVGDADGIEAMQQVVYHILMTERYAYAIYDKNYGVELRQYLGRGFAYLATTIQDTLRDALLQDDRISAVNVTRIAQTGKDMALIEFSVVCDRGTFQTEVVTSV